MSQLQLRSTHFHPQPSAAERTASIATVAALHVVIIYGFLTVTGFLPMPRFTPPMIVRPLPPVDKSDGDPPPMPPPVQHLDIPEHPIEQVVMLPVDPTATPPNTITISRPPPERLASVTPPPAPVVTPPKSIEATHTRPDYPPISIRLAEQGTVRLKISVTPEGAVDMAAVDHSSGYPRLDTAAIAWVKAHWRYEPARSDGKPIPASAIANVTFKLQ